MLSFLVTQPPRTRVAHLTEIHYDDGRSTVTYKPKSSGDLYWVVNRLPPAPAQPRTLNESNSALAPPPHWHYNQDETFKVLEGKAKFILDGKERYTNSNEIVKIPAGQIHTFRNASPNEELLLEFMLDPVRRERDEAFFRNVQTYRDDCRRHGVQRSLPQVLLFMRRGNVVMALPGPSSIAKLLGLLLNFWVGLVFGGWILGLSDTYPEYYHTSSS